jgi:poly(A) polymerase
LSVPVPVIVPRAEHQISRRDIDSDALKVLYRLHEHKYTAYLVGGSVRDLLLGRRPKDFDIGTDAHPYQIKKLFRNCWIIGRRFRLAHVKFGLKVIEVATFRRVVPETADAQTDSSSLPEPEAVVVASSPAPEAAAHDAETERRMQEILAFHGRDFAETSQPAASHAAGSAERHRREPSRRERAEPVQHDNTFGTPEEDAFRRDFTINGLFYDIGTLSVIDYVGGLEDLQARVVRSIGDPRVRFVEDPVRMLRAVVMASRLDFTMDPLVVDAIAEHRALIAKASPARLLEEYFKILRSGSAEATFRALGRARLLELITPELKSPSDAFWDWLGRLDRYRRQFPSAPPELTNTILAGALLVPTGILGRLTGRRDDHPERVSLGILPVAKKDVERLRHILQMLPRLSDPALPPRAIRGIVHRPVFTDALVWMEIFGESPDDVERWKQAAHQHRTAPSHAHGHGQPHAHGHAAAGHEGVPSEGEAPHRRRRRRRRRRRGGSRGDGGGPAA